MNVCVHTNIHKFILLTRGGTKIVNQNATTHIITGTGPAGVGAGLVVALAFIVEEAKGRK